MQVISKNMQVLSNNMQALSGNTSSDQQSKFQHSIYCTIK